jgi:superfamily II DNA or RNA helicase
MLALLERITDKKPRYYQEQVPGEVAKALRAGLTRILVKLPTGTGKTFTSKLIALSKEVREALGLPTGEGARALRILFISNRHRINRQAMAEYEGLETLELRTQSAFSDIPSDLRSWFDLVLIDEAHHEAMMSIQLQLDHLIGKPIIGFTADDERGDGFLLKFETIIQTITERRAAEEGFIEKVGVNTVLDSGGPDKSALAIEVVSRYHRHMGNTIVFFRTEAECRRLAEHLEKLSLTHAVLAGGSGEEDMDRELDRLSRGEIQFLLNCQRIGEGVDTPNVTDVLLCRQFSSAAEKRQYIGRAIRPDSPCAVWEFTNPIVDSVSAKSVVGLTKYERLIHLRKGEWHEKLLSGEDDTWGRMGELRVQPQAELEAAIAARRAAEGPLRLKRGGESLSLKERGIDTNLNPYDDMLEHAVESRRIEQLALFGGESRVYHQERRVRGERRRSEVVVTTKRRRRMAA